MTVTTEVTVPVVLNSLDAELKQQIRIELDGAEITNPERFMLEQKYGITEPVLTQGEKQAIKIAEAK